MVKPISTRMHGFIDYAYAGALLALPFALGWRARARNIAVTNGLATLGVSLLTNYECGALRLLPMKAHLAMDAAETSMLLGAPGVLGSGEANRNAGRVLAVMGAIGAVVAALTETESPYEQMERYQLAS